MFIVCKTKPTYHKENNPRPNENCVLPFEYYGIEHNGCTSANNNGIFWCNTDGYSSNTVGWGICNESCPRHEGTSCYFTLLKLELSLFKH